MGIFTRFKDIVSSNISAMLDKAEDPEKLIRLMIQEMEDTLVEIKASCAGAMASRVKARRALDDVRGQAEDWERKAELAVGKGRDDLALEALAEKRRFAEEAGRLEAEAKRFDEVVDQYRADIEQLEKKLAAARQKRQSLSQRHQRARQRHRAQSAIRKADSADAFARFDAFENRIERMEADADLVNAKAEPTLSEAFSKLEKEDAVEAELAALKSKLASRSAEK